MTNKVKHNDYRFFDELDAKGKPQHLHQIWSDRKNEYENMTGATTVLEVLGKVLTYWASGLAVGKLGWMNDKVRENGKVVKNVSLEERLAHLKPIREVQSKLDDKSYLALLDEAYKAHSVRLDETADAGTDLHAELESYVTYCIKKGGMPDVYEQANKMVYDFMVWANQNVKRFIWSEAYCYNELLFVGGITDCGAEMKDGSFAIIDFKSAKDVYFNHFIQIGIYNLLIEKHGLVDKDGNYFDVKLMPNELPKFTKYIVIPFGKKEFTAVENTNIKNLREAALACIKLYRAKSLFENN